MPEIIPILKQVAPIVSILLVSNIGTLIYFKVKNNSKKVEIMNVRSELRKIRRMEQSERENKLF